MTEPVNVPEATATPRFDVYVVDAFEGKDGEARKLWSRIGVAFPHKDQKGYSVKLHALPVGGELVLRAHETRPEPGST